MCYKPILLYLLFHSNYSNFIYLELFQLALVSFWYPLIMVDLFIYLFSSVCLNLFLSVSLFSGTRRCSRLILYVSYPSTTSSYVSKDICFILLKSGTRYHDLGTGFLLGYSGVLLFLGPLSWQPGDIYVYTKPCI